MKRCFAMTLAAALLLLTACSTGVMDDRADRLQERYAAMSGCTARYEAAIVTDTQTLRYELEASQTDGETRVTVRKPEELAGIAATVRGDGALSLSFDGMVLDAGSLDPNVSAANALSILLRAIAQGCAAEQGREAFEGTDALRVCFTTDCAGETLRAAAWFDADDRPLYAELERDGEILAYLEFTDFRFCDTMSAS